MDTERRAFVVRRWESLIENWTVRNCRLDCEVTCIRISLSILLLYFTEANINCITEHDSFDVVCKHPDVLRTAFI